MKTKPRIKKKKEVAGTFLRLDPDFKKRAKVYAIQNNITLSELFVNAVDKIIKDGN